MIDQRTKKLQAGFKQSMKEAFAEFRAAMKENYKDIKNKEPTAVKQVRVSGNRIVNIVSNFLLNLCIG